MHLRRLRSTLGLVAWLGCALGATVSGDAQTTTTTLAVTSGGTAVTTAAPGALITLSATVQSSSVPVTSGTVNFCNASALLCTDINLLGTAQLNSAGTATITLHPGFGSHSFVAKYQGTPNGATPYAASGSAAMPLTSTTRTSSSTTIASTGVAGSYTLTGTVATAGPVAFPSGIVSFVDTTNAGAVIASGPLVFGPQTVGMNQTAEVAADANTSFSGVAAGDFNADGKPDIAIVDSGNQIVSIYLGNGDGTFTRVAATSPTGAGPRLAVTGDFNNDGKVDLAVINSGDKTVTILLGNGDGTFTGTAQSPAIGLGAEALAVADFNRDGQLDLAAVNSDSRTITILLGAGDGTFVAGPQSPATGTDPQTIAVGDFNGDGNPDIATESYDDSTVSVLLGSGDGTFTTAPGSPYSVGVPTGVAAGDWNADGKLDLAVSETSAQLTVLVGNGSGSFTPVVTPLPLATDRSSVASGDFNADGVADLAIEYPDYTKIVLGNGNSTFTPVLDLATLAQTQYQAIADFNLDDVVDLAVAHTVCTQSTCPAGVTVSVPSLTKTAVATVTGVAIIGTGTHEVNATYSGDLAVDASVSETTPLTATSIDVLPAAATPIFNPPAGTYTSAQAVTITDVSTGATIYYTTDNSEPTTGSHAYGAPLSISTTTTVKAFATGGSFSASPIATATYTINTSSVPNPDAPNYSIGATPLTLKAGASGSSTVTISGTNSYAGKVSLVCAVTGSPAGAVHLPTCAIGGTVTLSASVISGTATVQVSTTAPVVASTAPAPPMDRNKLIVGTGGAVLAFLILLWVPKARRDWRGTLGVLILMGLLASVSACGGGSSSSKSTDTSPATEPGTTAGTYIVTVNAVGDDSAKTAASTTFTLTVQ